MATAIALFAAALCVTHTATLRYADRKFAEHDGQPRIHAEQL